MSDYMSGGNTSSETESTDSNQTTSDSNSDGSNLEILRTRTAALRLQDATSDPDGSSGDAVRERDEHLGAVEIDVSSSVTAYHYDDEPDSLLLTTDGDTIRVSPKEARSLVGDMTTALSAIANERAEEDP